MNARKKIGPKNSAVVVNPATTLFALLSYLFALILAGLVAYFWLQFFAGKQLNDQSLVFFAVAIASALASMLFSYLNVRKTKKTAAELLFFSTWFPLLMAVGPGIGALFALWGCVQLLGGFILGGRVSTGTITYGNDFSGSSRVYRTQKIGRSALGGGFVLLLVVLVQALYFLPHSSIPAKIAKEFGLKPIEYKWDTNTELNCSVEKTYVASNANIVGNIFAAGDCHVILKNCKVMSDKVSFSGHSRLDVKGGKIFGRVRFTDNAQGSFHTVKSMGPGFSFYLAGHARIDLSECTITSKQGQILHAAQFSVANFDDVEVTAEEVFYSRDNAQIQLKNSTMTASKDWIFAAGKSQLVIENVDAKIPGGRGVRCRDDAQISMTGGSLMAKTAIDPNGRCQVSYANTEIKGRMRRAKKHVKNINKQHYSGD